MKMKKILICAAGIGLAAGLIYWLYTKDKSHKVTTKTSNNMMGENFSEKEETSSNSKDVVEEMYQAKNSSVQAVYERHSEAGKIMKDAYSNIMEDFVQDFSDEDTVKDKNNNTVIDSESVSVIKKLDSISDELDDLLK